MTYVWKCVLGVGKTYLKSWNLRWILICKNKEIIPANLQNPKNGGRTPPPFWCCEDIICLVALFFRPYLPQTVHGETTPTYLVTHWTVFVSRASLPLNVVKSARTPKPRLPERLVGNAAKPALMSAMTPRHVIRILRIDIRLYILNFLPHHWKILINSLYYIHLQKSLLELCS